MVTNSITIQKIWDTLATISDPEIPVISILDLGIVRKIVLNIDNINHTFNIEDINTMAQNEQKYCIINIQSIILDTTPTYSGCPAMGMIGVQIYMVLLALGFKDVKINTILSPSWTTDWLSETAKNKLKLYGIAPPHAKARLQKWLFDTPSVSCPFCDSNHTEMLAEFGSTSCKSLYRCKDCLEPFDYFKCH